MKTSRPKVGDGKAGQTGLRALFTVLALGLLGVSPVFATTPVPFQLTATSPVNGGVAHLNDPIVLTFNGPVLASSVVLNDENSMPISSGATVIISPTKLANGTDLGFHHTVSGNTITITHDQPFDQSHIYQVNLVETTISGVLTSVQSSDMTDFPNTTTTANTPSTGVNSNPNNAASHVPPLPFTFTTTSTVPPTVTHTPADGTGTSTLGATDCTSDGARVDNNAPIVFTFSKPMAINTIQVSVTPSFAFTSTWSANGTILTIQPTQTTSGVTTSAPLAGPVKYTVDITAGMDLDGNSLQRQNDTNGDRLPFSFVTKNNTIRPNLVSVSPANNATGVDPDQPIVLTFDQAISAANLPGAITSSPTVPGGFSAALDSTGKIVTFNHSTALSGNQTYTITVAQNANNDSQFVGQCSGLLAYNAGSKGFSFSFTTGNATPPSIVSISQGSTQISAATASSLVGVSPTTPFTIKFSQAVSPPTVTLRRLTFAGFSAHDRGLGGATPLCPTATPGYPYPFNAAGPIADTLALSQIQAVSKWVTVAPTSVTTPDNGVTYVAAFPPLQAGPGPDGVHGSYYSLVIQAHDAQTGRALTSNNVAATTGTLTVNDTVTEFNNTAAPPAPATVAFDVTVPTTKPAPLQGSADDSAEVAFETKPTSPSAGPVIVAECVEQGGVSTIANGANLQPETNANTTTLTIQFSNTVFFEDSNGKPIPSEEPQIALTYAINSGSLQVNVAGTDATQLTPGLFRLDQTAAWSSSILPNDTVTLHFAQTTSTSTPAPTNFFDPGNFINTQVIAAQDPQGNQLRTQAQFGSTPLPIDEGVNSPAAAPNPFSIGIIDTRPPTVTITPNTITSTDPTGASTLPVSLFAPIVFRFSRQMQTNSVDFTLNATAASLGGAGFFNGTATLLMDNVPASGSTWQVATGAFDPTATVATLTHMPFPEATGATLNSIVGQPWVLHTVTVTTGMSQTGLAQLSLVANVPADSASFGTTIRPRINGAYYAQASSGVAADGTEDLTKLPAFDSVMPGAANTNLVPLFGIPALPNCTPTTTGIVGTATSFVPLNAPIVFTFNLPMDTTTVTSPTTAQGAVAWLTPRFFSNQEVVVFNHTPFPDPIPNWGPGTPAIAPTNGNPVQALSGAELAPPITGLTLTAGKSITGDVLVALDSTAVKDCLNNPSLGATIAPVDANAIAITSIEYLKAGATAFSTTESDWLDLTKATGPAVPPTTQIRVTFNKPIDETGTVPTIQSTGSNAPSLIGGANTAIMASAFGNVDTSGPKPTTSAPTADNKILANAAAYFDFTTNKLAEATNFGQVTITAQDTRPATDGGPNTYKQNFSFNVARFTCPQVVSITVASNGQFPQPTDAVVVKFDIPVNPATVSLVNVQQSNDANNTGPLVTFDAPTSPDGGTTLIFTHVATPFQLPTSGAPLKYHIEILGTGGTSGDQIQPDQGGATNGAGNPLPSSCTKAQVAVLLSSTTVNKGQGVTFSPGNYVSKIDGQDFVVGVPLDATPPKVLAVIADRDQVILQFSKPVISTTDATNGDANTGFGVSAANPANYSAPLDTANFRNTIRGFADVVPTTVAVDYSYWNPTATNTGTGGAFETVQRTVLDATYNAATNTVTLDLATPMIEGAGTNQPELVTLRVGNIRDLNTNQITAANATTDLAASVQTGRRDFQIGLSATSDQPLAASTKNVVLGVAERATAAQNAAQDGFQPPSGALDANGNLILDGDVPAPPPVQSDFVSVASVRSAADDPSFGNGNGGAFAVDILHAPNLNEVLNWPHVVVTTDLGSDATGPANITLSWNLNVPGHEVPAFDTVALEDPNDINGDGITEYDMRKISSFSFPAKANFSALPFTLGVRVYTPSAPDPVTFPAGFNLIGVPLNPINPRPDAVFASLFPPVLYRFNAVTGSYELFPMDPSFTSIETGRGYWILPKSGYTLNLLGSPNVGAQNLTLQPGWNMISLPFLKPVAGSSLLFQVGGKTLGLNDAVTASAVEGNVLTYDNTAKTYRSTSLKTGSLQPYVGYFILNPTTAPIVLTIPAPSS